jgi:hypothetical protein
MSNKRKEEEKKGIDTGRQKKHSRMEPCQCAKTFVHIGVQLDPTVKIVELEGGHLYKTYRHKHIFILEP